MQDGDRQTATADQREAPSAQTRARRRFLSTLALSALPAVASADQGSADTGVGPDHGTRGADMQAWLPRAEDWNAGSFALHSEAQVTSALGVPGTPRSGPEVQLSAPEIAENGAVVPVEVRTTLTDVRRIVLVVPANPNALVADFRFGKRASPLLGTRIKLAGTCEVIALVETGSGWWRAQKSVKVTLGGCGG